jgi:SAM-dependent methyltransferase
MTASRPEPPHGASCDPTIPASGTVSVPRFPTLAQIRNLGLTNDWGGRQAVAGALLLSLQPRRVLDVGAKDGWLVRQLKAYGISAVGVDIHPGSPPVIAADARRLPFRDGSMDVVALLDVIEHLPRGSETQALRECARVLRSEGILVLSTPSAWTIGTCTDPAWWLRGHRHYTAEALRKLVRDAGLSIVDLQTRGGWSEVVGLPPLYLVSRLHLPMPAGRAHRRWSWRDYSKSELYTHFVVATSDATDGRGDRG